MDINFENFSKFKILVGTIISIEINKKAKKPAFELDVDFGKEIVEHWANIDLQWI